MRPQTKNRLRPVQSWAFYFLREPVSPSLPEFPTRTHDAIRTRNHPTAFWICRKIGYLKMEEHDDGWVWIEAMQCHVYSEYLRKGWGIVPESWGISCEVVSTHSFHLYRLTLTLPNWAWCRHEMVAFEFYICLNKNYIKYKLFLYKKI